MTPPQPSPSSSKMEREKTNEMGGDTMNDRFTHSNKESSKRDCEILPPRGRDDAAILPGRTGASDHRERKAKARLDVRDNVPTTIRQERTAGASRSLPADDLLAISSRNSESLTHLETPKSERHAKVRAHAEPEPGDEAKLAKRTRLHLPDWISTYLFFVWRPYCKCGWGDSKFIIVL